MNNRYLIYELLNKSIKEVEKNNLTGIVSKVFRDILEDRIVFIVGGHAYYYDEPSTIIKEGNKVIFKYGYVNNDDSDEALFNETARESYKGNALYDALSNLNSSNRKSVVFELL